MRSFGTWVARPLRGKVGRGVLALGSAAAIGQVVSIATAPILTRLYDPAAYGVLAVFSSVVALLAALSTLRYELAIPLPEGSHEARVLVRLCLCLVVAASTLSWLAWSIWGGSLASLFGVPTLGGYAALVGVAVLLMGAYATLGAWAVRSRAYTLIARTRLTQSVSGIATSMALGFAGLGPIGLLLGNIANGAAGIASLARLFWRERPAAPAALRSTLGMAACAKRYRRFPLYSTWQTLLGTAGQYAPPVVFSSVFGGSVAGYYALATRLCLLPMIVIGQSMSQVFFGEAASLRSDARGLAALTDNAAGWLAAISIPVFGVLLAFGPAIFTSMLGPEWAAAGLYSRLMAPWLAVATVSTSLSFLPMVLERQAAATVYAVCDAGVRVAALIVAAATREPWVAVAALSLAGASSAMYYLLWCLHLARASIRRFLGHSAACGVAAALPILLSIVTTSGHGSWVSLVGAIVSGILALTLSCAVYRVLSTQRKHGGDGLERPTEESGEEAG